MSLRWLIFALVILLVPAVLGSPDTSPDPPAAMIVSPSDDLLEMAKDLCNDGGQESQRTYLWANGGDEAVWLHVAARCTGPDDTSAPPGPTLASTCLGDAYVLNPYKWVQPYSFYYDGRAAPAHLAEEEVLAQLDDAARTWEEAVFPKQIYGVGTAVGNLDADAPGLDGLNILAWAARPADNLATAFTWYIGGVAVESDHVYNNQQPWALSITPTAYHFWSTAGHELGHTFGLDHTPVDAAYRCQMMYPYSAKGESSPLTRGDVAGIRDRYDCDSTTGLWPPPVTTMDTARRDLCGDRP